MDRTEVEGWRQGPSTETSSPKDSEKPLFLPSCPDCLCLTPILRLLPFIIRRLPSPCLQLWIDSFYQVWGHCFISHWNVTSDSTYFLLYQSQVCIDNQSETLPLMWHLFTPMLVIHFTKHLLNTRHIPAFYWGPGHSDTLLVCRIEWDCQKN